jgi:hypothetical protein
MDGVTKFLVYLRVLLCPSPLTSPVRKLVRNLRVGHTTFLSLSVSIARFPSVDTRMSVICPELWVHEAVTCLEGRGRGQNNPGREVY